MFFFKWSNLSRKAMKICPKIIFCYPSLCLIGWGQMSYKRINPSILNFVSLCKITIWKIIFTSPKYDFPKIYGRVPKKHNYFHGMGEVIIRGKFKVTILTDGGIFPLHPVRGDFNANYNSFSLLLKYTI